MLPTRKPKPVVKTTKKQQGFQKGVSGNPHGRPRGSYNKATLLALQMVEKDLQRITQTGIDLALDGDRDMIKFLLSRMLPKDRPVRFPVVDIKDSVQAILGLVSRGELTPDEGKSVAEIIGVLDLAEKVEQLTRKMEEMKK
jgi:hypothetical protein